MDLKIRFLLSILKEFFAEATYDNKIKICWVLTNSISDANIKDSLGNGWVFEQDTRFVTKHSDKDPHSYTTIKISSFNPDIYCGIKDVDNFSMNEILEEFKSM